MEDSDRFAVAVVGPTASGKTRLAIQIASDLDGEIVSCDSMQIYKGMDIASAKPTADELNLVRHHLVSFVNDGDNYSVADFCRDAKIVSDDIFSRGKMPVFAGGTGLYIDSFLNNITFGEQSPDQALRNELNGKDNQELFDMLKEIDPEYAEKLNINDKKRIVRGIEVYINTGITMTESLVRSRKNKSDIRVAYIGINFRDRKKLYDRIDRRIDRMIESGLVEEARKSFEINNSSTSFQAIGHKEFLPYFNGEKPLEECIERLKTSTRRYAKRQISWFGGNKEIMWLYADECDRSQLVKKAIEYVLAKKEENNGKE